MWWLYHILYGRHSGISWCCIIAFIRHTATPDKDVGYAVCKRHWRNGNAPLIHYCTPKYLRCRLWTAFVFVLNGIGVTFDSRLGYYVHTCRHARIDGEEIDLLERLG